MAPVSAWLPSTRHGNSHSSYATSSPSQPCTAG
jgi:hypothetical protein